MLGFVIALPFAAALDVAYNAGRLLGAAVAGFTEMCN